MQRQRFFAAAGAALMFVVVTLMSASSASAADSYKVLYKFTGGSDGNEFLGISNGGSPGLVLDADGTLYGTTQAGGVYGYGVVFKLTPNSDGSWTESVLYSFTGAADGAHPFAGLIFDTSGNLYGTASGGGSGSCSNGYTTGCGVVFELMPNLDGSWTEKVLYSFNGGADGAQPETNLTFDAAGNLYGTADAGGLHLSGPCPNNPFGYLYDNGCGVVFELTLNADGSWTESVLHRFTGGRDGGQQIGSLTFDDAGNLYSTAQYGKCQSCGIVFRLTPTSTGWKETVLHNFTGGIGGKDGSDPFSFSGLVFDEAGSLYGTSFWGPKSGGTVFKLTPTSTGRWKWSLVHSFSDSYHPVAGVILDSAGNLYGTDIPIMQTLAAGRVFKLTLTSGGGWKYTVLHTFLNKPLSDPVSLIFGAGGSLYGTGLYSDRAAGGVFEIAP